MSNAGFNNALSTGEKVQSVQAQQSISSGAQLAAYRQERGWTIEQVASQLNLAPRQIAALESDDYSALPGMAIVRGFIRAYAKLLKVDSAAILAGLSGETTISNDSLQPRKTLATPFSETRLPIMAERSGLFSKWLFGLLLLLLLGVAIWSTQSGVIAKFSRSATSQVKGDLDYLSTSKPAEQNPVEQKPAVSEVLSPVTPPVASSKTEAAIDTLPVAVQAAPEPSSDLAKGLDTAPHEGSAAAVSKDSLLLKVNKDSWIEVRRVSSNSVVISGIEKAGTAENVIVSEPMSIVIGNAAGVEASFRGAPLELQSSANNNIARLTLK